MGTKGLGNEVYFNNKKFLCSETNDTCHKRVSSLKICGLQDQLVIGELRVSWKPFQNIVTRPVVMHYRYGFGFAILFQKSCFYSFQEPVYQCLEDFLKQMIEQVSLLSNSMWHLKVCKALWKVGLTKWTTMFFEGLYETYKFLWKVFWYKWSKTEDSRLCELKE
jgi:hypothetical protein